MYGDTRASECKGALRLGALGYERSVRLMEQGKLNERAKVGDTTASQCERALDLRVLIVKERDDRTKVQMVGQGN